MKSKKGFLLAEETVKIIIALICIGFLIYLLGALYLANRDARDLKFAESTLDRLVKDINNGATSFEIYSPTPFGIFSWSISSWPSASGNIPKSCSNLGWQNCICICNHDNWGPTLLKNCESPKMSSCKEIKNVIVGEDTPLPIQIKEVPLSLKINHLENLIRITKL